MTLKVSLVLMALAALFLDGSLLFPTPLIAADFSGHVVSVLDGDTLYVFHNGPAERIRLNGIDCPEKGQAYGQRAKQAASDLVFGKEVTCSKPMARISAGAPLPRCSCRMARMSITRWSKTAGAGGIGSMRRGIPR